LRIERADPLGAYRIGPKAARFSNRYGRADARPLQHASHSADWEVVSAKEIPHLNGEMWGTRNSANREVVRSRDATSQKRDVVRVNG
jgi:hypothetical protein